MKCSCGGDKIGFGLGECPMIPLVLVLGLAGLVVALLL